MGIVNKKLAVYCMVLLFGTLFVVSLGDDLSSYDILFQTNAIPDNSYTANNMNNGQWLGTVLNTTHSVTLNGIQLLGFINGAGHEGYVNITSINTATGKPSGYISNGTFDADNLVNTTDAGVYLNVSVTPVELSANTAYGIVVYFNCSSANRGGMFINQSSDLGYYSILTNDDGGTWGNSDQEAYYFDLYGANITTNLTVTLETPTDNSFGAATSQDFRCVGNDSSNYIDNVTFNLWDSGNTLDASTFRALTSSWGQNESFSVSALTDDIYVWNCDYVNNVSETGFASSNFTFTVDTIIPSVSIELPTSVYTSTASTPLNYTANDTNINACWYSLDGGGTNNTITSCANTTFTSSSGDNVLDLWVNDSAGNLIRNQTNFTVIGTPVSFNITQNVLELEESAFAVYITNGSATFSSAELFYNGTSYDYTASSNNGSGVFLNRTITTLKTGNLTGDRQVNYTFYWNITWLYNGIYTSVQTPQEINQSVHQKYVDECDGGETTTIAVNYSVRDEDSNAALSANFSHLYSPLSYLNNELRTHNYSEFATYGSAMCIAPAWANFSVNTFLEYSINSTYDTRQYVFDNQTFDNSSRTVTLLLLNSGSSTDVTVNVRDQNDNNLEGYTVSAYKFNVDTNDYDFVQSGITDFAGQTLFQLDSALTYRFIITLEGDEVLREDNIKLIGTSPELYFTVTIGAVSPGEAVQDTYDFDSTLIFNATGGDDYNISFTWNDSGSSYSSVCLRVNNDTASDTTEMYNACSTLSAGFLNFSLHENKEGHFVARSYGTSNIDVSTQYFDVLYVHLNVTDLTIYGQDADVNDGLFFTSLIVLTMGGMGLATGNPAVMILLVILGVGISTILGFLSLTKAGIMAIIAIGGFVIYKLRT